MLNESGSSRRSVRYGSRARILNALDYIHKNGVVHRDLKPENIMVDEQDNIKLIDFGIAANVGSRRLTFAKLSQTMGTPDYISPEQVRGKRGDARSDLYAVGVMLYEMLTGKVPFTGPNAFVIMNDRLLNNPMPPREIDPDDHAAIAGDHLSRDGARSEEALCVKRMNLLGTWNIRIRSGVAERPELKDWKTREAVAANGSFLRDAGADPGGDLRAAAVGGAALGAGSFALVIILLLKDGIGTELVLFRSDSVIDTS